MKKIYSIAIEEKIMKMIDNIISNHNKDEINTKISRSMFIESILRKEKEEEDYL